jgi:hypothetical protein
MLESTTFRKKYLSAAFFQVRVRALERELLSPEQASLIAEDAVAFGSPS